MRTLMIISSLFIAVNLFAQEPQLHISDSPDHQGSEAFEENLDNTPHLMVATAGLPAPQTTAGIQLDPDQFPVEKDIFPAGAGLVKPEDFVGFILPAVVFFALFVPLF
jgi:hypothetical protein